MEWLSKQLYWVGCVGVWCVIMDDVGMWAEIVELQLLSWWWVKSAS